VRIFIVNKFVRLYMYIYTYEYLSVCAYMYTYINVYSYIFTFHIDGSGKRDDRDLVVTGQVCIYLL